MADTFFIDIESTLLDPRGIAYPFNWVEEVEVTPATETEPSITEFRLKTEHQSYPWTPAIIGQYDGKNIYFELGEMFSSSYRDEGIYLASDYYFLSTLYPEIAVNCAEAEYTLNGETGRCKVADLPEGALVSNIFAPVKYSGVDTPTNPSVTENELFPTTIKEISVTDAQLILMKETVKIPAITWIKTHPDGMDYDAVAWIGSEFGESYAGIATALLNIYIQNSVSKGLIANESWETFRDWIVATPVELLMSL